MTMVFPGEPDPRRHYTYIDRYADAAESLIQEGETWITFLHLAMATFGAPLSRTQKDECQAKLRQIKRKLELRGYTVNLVTEDFDPTQPLTRAEAFSVLPIGRGRKSFALHIPPATPGQDDPVFMARSERNFTTAIGKVDAEITRIETAQQREVMAPRRFTPQQARRIVWNTVRQLGRLMPPENGYR